MRRRRVILGGCAVAAAAIYLTNASWLAAAPAGRPTLIAQRGVHQVFDPVGVDATTCTAQRIPAPTHRLIENTIPSIRAAVKAGADVVEVDVRETADGEFILFHDATLECRTDGRGPVGQSEYADLKRLDLGYGYTADGGQSFPLRGHGRGLMTTLAEAMQTFPGQHFLVQLKDGRSSGTNLVTYLNRRVSGAWARVSLLGDKPATTAMKEQVPNLHVVHDKTAQKCAFGYLALGWMGRVPEACRNGTLFVPASLRHLLWGWPNRFLARMKTSNTQVVMIGSVPSFRPVTFLRLDDPQQLQAIPDGFDGAIWTDRIELIGPEAAKRWPH